MKHNYNNYSKPQVMSEPTPDAENTPVSAPEETEEVINTEPSEPKVEDTIEPEEPAKVEPKTGIVTADKLRIRKLPSAMEQVLTIVPKNTTLAIDSIGETSDWYKVVTPAGVEGYCMKKFVEVK